MVSIVLFMGKLIDAISRSLDDLKEGWKKKIFLVDEEMMNELEEVSNVGDLEVLFLKSREEMNKYSLQRIGGTECTKSKIENGKIYVVDSRSMGGDAEKFVSDFIVGRFFSNRHDYDSKVVVLGGHYTVSEWFEHDDKLGYLVRDLR